MKNAQTLRKLAQWLTRITILATVICVVAGFALVASDTHAADHKANVTVGMIMIGAALGQLVFMLTVAWIGRVLADGVLGAADSVTFQAVTTATASASGRPPSTGKARSLGRPDRAT
jgi:hypothetical protein